MATPAENFDARVVSDVDDAQWQDLLAADPRARVFQEPWVVRAFARTLPRSQARWLELRSAGGDLLAGLPFVERRRGPLRAWISLPCGAYGGPVLRAAHPQSTEHELALLAAFLEGKQPGVLLREIVFGHREPAMARGMSCVDSALLELEGGYESFLRERFPKNRRNECNRSERRGMRIRRERDPELLRAFYPVYAERGRAWETEVLPFELMQTLLDGSEKFQFFAAELDGEIVGGHLCAAAADELFAWVGTTKRLDATFASSLLIREEARFAAESGCARLNLGSSLGISGVSNYKRLLGAQSRPLWIGRREARAIRVLRRLRGGR